MDKKIIVIVVAAIVIIAAAAAVALTMDDEEDVGVVYDGNGGKTSDGDSSFLVTSNNVMENLFVKDGYVFVCWNESRDGDAKSYNPGDHIDFPSDGNVKVYAIWKEDTSKHITGVSIGTMSSYASEIQKNTHIKLSSDGKMTDVDLDQIKYTFAPYDGKGVLFISMDGSTDWSWNDTESCFHFKLNGVEHTLKIVASGSDASTGEVTEEFGAAFAFSSPGDISLSINFTVVH